MEEYDDLEGDRPSCYSGVPRRLFQSVRGHPLLNILTKSIIDAELRGLILSHLRKSVNPENRSAIHSAWDKIISLDKLTQDDIAVLTSLNISEEKQGQFIGYLRDKYQEQFTEDPSFLVQIKKKFSLKENEFHVQNFGHCLMDFFEEERSQVTLKLESAFESHGSIVQDAMQEENEPLATEEERSKVTLNPESAFKRHRSIVQDAKQEGNEPPATEESPHKKSKFEEKSSQDTLNPTIVAKRQLSTIKGEQQGGNEPPATEKSPHKKLRPN